MKKTEQENISYSDVNVEDFSSITGRGIKGFINGTTYYIGSPKLFKELFVPDFSQEFEDKVRHLQKSRENCDDNWYRTKYSCSYCRSR